jgi:hypothetical protein
MRQMGRLHEAHLQMSRLIPQGLAINEPGLLIFLGEDYAAVLSALGDHRRAIRLLAAAEAMRERLGAPRTAKQQALIGGPIAESRAALSTQEWDDEYQEGQDTALQDALIRATN